MEFLRSLIRMNVLDVVGTILIFYVFFKFLILGVPGFRRFVGKLFGRRF